MVVMVMMGVMVKHWKNEHARKTKNGTFIKAKLLDVTNKSVF